MATVDDAFSYAQSLSPAEQVELISRLWESVPKSEFKPPPTHLAEVERRWAEYKAGRMNAVPWSQVWSEVQAELDSHD